MIQHPPSWYLQRNIMLTSSGVCDDAALRCALDSLGENNVMFSIDYPFEDTKSATGWMRGVNVSEKERNKVSWKNATRLMKI